MKSNLRILLESDTNELELLEFCVNDGPTPGFFGVNVAKVLEIIRMPQLTRIAMASEVIAGTFVLRDKVIPVIDLAKVLGRKSDKPAERIIILDFNLVTVGFMVDKASRIHRLSWQQIEAPPDVMAGLHIIALVKMGEKIIQLLDFERILAEISEFAMINPGRPHSIGATRTANKKVLFVDDSSFIRSSICGLLRTTGYQVDEAINGEDAWAMIQSKLESDSFDIDAVLTDVEMPRMDGLHLTSLIRKDPRLAGLPVFIFSSLASEDNKRKWKQIGANGIITKPDLPRLVEILDQALAEL